MADHTIRQANIAVCRRAGAATLVVSAIARRPRLFPAKLEQLQSHVLLLLEAALTRRTGRIGVPRRDVPLSWTRECGGVLIDPCSHSGG